MSYSRNYNTSITINETVDYPSSNTGGSTRVSFTVPVSVNITVDTNPFDRSLNKFSDHITLLTGAVIAAEASEIAMIAENANKISGSIITGFFGYIRSGISQQISEYRPKVEAGFVELVKQREMCLSKMNQMKEDYQRISERYTNIFNDLDKETRNRIRAINEEAFSVNSNIYEQLHRTTESGLSSVPIISNDEIEQTHSLLFSSRLKNRVMLLMSKAKSLILDDKRLKQMLNLLLINDKIEISKIKYLPLLLMESNIKDKGIRSELYFNTKLPAFNTPEFRQNISDEYSAEKINWESMNEGAKSELNRYLQNDINSIDMSQDQHSKRVADVIRRLWTNNSNILLTK